MHNKDVFIQNEVNSGSKDGVHFTPLGYRCTATAIHPYLKMNIKMADIKNIICFGSLTYGVGIEKPGEVTGENYPEILFELI